MKLAGAEKGQIDFISKMSDIRMTGKNQTNRRIKQKILRVFMMRENKVKHIY